MKNPYLLSEYNNPQLLLQEIKTLPEDHWIQRGERMALRLFHEMSQRVPVYKDFLKKNKIDPSKIKTITDFKQVPTIDKINYLKNYSREDLCWDGDIKGQRWMISSTSGSTGEPFYFPRQESQDIQYALTAELYLRANFEIHKKSTLYIVGFPLGVWIGGMFTYQALKYISETGRYKLSIITPGINKLEIIKAVKNLGGNFDQILIGSYAPFLKDILDDAENLGLNWKKYDLGFIFSAEVITEVFRDYLARKTGLKNIYTSTLNHYGTVDMGTMAHETPLSIMLRRMGLKNKNLYKLLFSEVTKLPTLAQFNPEHFFFEEIDGNLLCSAYSGYPLVRYDLKDHGGVFTLKSTSEKMKNLGINLYKKMDDAKINDTLWNLPFVYVYERSDFSVSFYAFQIYPETIRRAVQRQEIENEITGKFTMLVKYNKSGRQKFEINLELKSDIEPNSRLKLKIRDIIVEQLLTDCSEYRKTHEVYGKTVYPDIKFWPYEHALYFRPGIKQKWVKK